MRVAFLHVKAPGGDDVLPSIMARSVRNAMPQANIVQMSDRKTPIVLFANEIWRDDYTYRDLCKLEMGTIIPAGLMVFRMRMLAKLDDEPTIILDTDTFVQKDLSSVFDDEFDIALTERSEVIERDSGENIAKRMPFNTGVMFSRSGQFWKDCLAEVWAMQEGEKNWTGDQLAVVAVASRYKLKRLPVDPWNYSPISRDDDVSDKYVVHYKGPRKKWMVDRGA